MHGKSVGSCIRSPDIQGQGSTLIAPSWWSASHILNVTSSIFGLSGFPQPNLVPMEACFVHAFDRYRAHVPGGVLLTDWGPVWDERRSERRHVPPAPVCRAPHHCLHQQPLYHGWIQERTVSWTWFLYLLRFWMFDNTDFIWIVFLCNEYCYSNFAKLICDSPGYCCKFSVFGHVNKAYHSAYISIIKFVHLFRTNK